LKSRKKELNRREEDIADTAEEKNQEEREMERN
jgi:hypothetical protein